MLTSLQRTATNSDKDTTLRCQALEVLALLTFAVEEDQLEIDKTMTGCAIVAKQSGKTERGIIEDDCLDASASP